MFPQSYLEEMIKSHIFIKQNVIYPQEALDKKIEGESFCIGYSDYRKEK